MNNLNLLDRWCSYHTSEPIILVCLDKDCVDGKRYRVICSECLAKGDHHHFKNRPSLKNLDEIIKTISSDSSKLVQTINKYIESFYALLNQLKKQVSNQYGFSMEQLNQKQNKEFNQYLSSIINFNNLEKEISETLEKQWKDFSNSINKLLQVSSSKALGKLTIDQEIDQLYTKGSKQFQDKDYENALKSFDQVLSLNPIHIQSLAYKGRILYFLDKFEESIRSFDKAIALDAKNLMALYGKGDTLRLQEKDKESIPFFNEALKVDSKCKEGLRGKGDALKMIGQFKESLKFYEKAIDVDSQYKEALWGKGDALRLLKQYDQSLQFLNKALDIDSNYPYALGSKGATLYEVGNYCQAEIWLKKALYQDPKNEFVKNQLSNINIKSQGELNQKMKRK